MSDFKEHDLELDSGADSGAADVPGRVDASQATEFSPDSIETHSPKISFQLGYQGSQPSYASTSIDRSEEEPKPFMGGFRDRRNGKEYHHAFTETFVERVSKWAGKPPRLCRETQTTTTASRSVQSGRECSTQTLRHDIYTDTAYDVELHSRPYFTAAQWLIVRDSKALIIQCRWRGFQARRRAKAIRAKMAAHKALSDEADAKKQADAEKEYSEAIERRLHPKTLEDFSVLYDEVEAWRIAETAKIKETITVEREQQEALAMLLAKETALLGTIERLRISASKDMAESKISTKLEQMAAPKQWKLATGEVATVHTPFTTRATELKALYDGLLMTGFSAEERTNLLLHVKYTVTEFDCALSREIVNLIEREIDMLGRKRPEESFTGIRQRLKTLFLTFCETPTFNPEAAHFQKLPAGIVPSAVPSMLDTRSVAATRTSIY